MKLSGDKSRNFSGEKFRATRPLDYIYDPLFTFSGPKSYNKMAQEAYKTSSEFFVQPIFDSMFSDMVRYPRATLTLRPSHLIPNSIDSSYKGKVKATSQERTVVAEVTGPDRYKYFRRPVTEIQAGTPATTRFPLLGVDNVTNLGIMAPPTTAEKLRERSTKLSDNTQVRGVQTDYREAETQTIPWAPPYVTCGRTTPEVLHLDRLTWGNGLPPGKHEVDVVEHLRKKQAWEAVLPPLDTEANTKKRFKLISDMEKSDWEFREKEVEAVHEERMKKSEQLLEQHVLLNRTRLSYRLEFLEDDLNKRKERKLQVIRHEKERALRKLCMKEKGYNPKFHKMNIVDEHLQRTSQIYAPLKRFGTSLRNRNEILSEKHITIDSADLHEVEYETNYKPAFDYNKASQPKKQTELCIRETRWSLENLAKLHQDLQTLRSSKKDTFYTHAVELLTKPVKVRDIPSVAMEPEMKERVYQATIMIQRVINGRAMQIQMHQTRDRWKEVMDELKSSEALTPKQLAAINAHKDLMNFLSRTAGMTENIIGLNVGKSIGETLHLLAVELLRLKNEGIAHSQALNAECARWKREVPESGRRQKEMRRREEHNLMFTQLMEVYQDSINTFLDSLVSKAQAHEAKTEAFEFAKEVALVSELEKAIEEDVEEEEPVSADLLFEFIAPEGLKELTRVCMVILKQKYEEARQHLVEATQTESLPDGQSDMESTIEEAGACITLYSKSNIDVDDASVVSLQSRMAPPVVRFGLATAIPPEDRLLARIMRDMCYVAGALLHTAAKILNKALQLSCLPHESFEEALKRTFAVINEAREEIARLILPEQKIQPEVFVLPSKVAPEGVVFEAALIVDKIISKARERIDQTKGMDFTAHKQALETDVKERAKQLVEDVIRDAQRKIFQSIVEDFLTDLLTEAEAQVDSERND